MGCVSGKPRRATRVDLSESTTRSSGTRRRPSDDDPDRLILTKAEWTGTKTTEGAIDSRYALEQELGRGGSAKVYKARRKDDSKVLAAKSVLLSAPSAPPVERVLMEAELWEQVSSPYHDAILQLVEIVRAADGLHLVTELMPYGELFDALDHIVFSEQACRMVTVQVASAIAHLHLRHHVAHCDIKPQNILCRHADPTVPGALKLADFGFTQRFTSRSRPAFTTTCGTLDYFAPELAAGLRNTKQRTGLVVKYGPAVDLWALGCMVYELLHGEPPFFAPKDDALQLELIEKAELSFPSESFGTITEHGTGFLRGLLQPQPASRLYIEDALRHAWLQPVHDAAEREQLERRVAESAISRRQERYNARRRMRVAALKVMALRRLSDPKCSVDQFREALQAASAPSGSDSGAAPAGAVSAAGAASAAIASALEDSSPERRLTPDNLRAHDAALLGAKPGSSPLVRAASGEEPPERETTERRRLSDTSCVSATSCVSYASDEMRPRNI